MDWFDFLSAGTEGTRKMRIVGAVVGAVIGAFCGFLFGYATVQIVPLWMMVSYMAIGAVSGALLGALFAGFMVLLLVVVFGATIWGIAKFVVGI